MIINSLQLTSFGKFQQKEVSFKDGFNILEGENEIGKTTIHKFIEGMLFGFLDPTKSRRTYSDDHAKYQPRNASGYRGSMSLTIDDKTYRIDRNFDKKQAEVKLFDEKNGEDLTDKLPIHPSLKLPDIADFIGISYKLYANTISTSQLLRNTEKDLGEALIERLHNITTTKDESISIKEVHNDLDKFLLELGSEKAKTKPYAKAIKSVEDLKEEIRQSTSKYEQSERLFNEKNHLQDEIDETKSNLQTVNQDINQYYNTKKKEQYQKASQLKKHLEHNALKISTNQSVMNLSEEDYDQLHQIKNELKHLQQKKLDLQSTETDTLSSIQINEGILEKHRAFDQYQQSIYQFRDLFYTRQNIKDEVQSTKQTIHDLENELNEIIVNEEVIIDHQKVEEMKEKKDSLDITALEQTLFHKEQAYEELANRKFYPVVKVLYYVLYLFVIGLFLQKKRNEKLQRYQEKMSLVTKTYEDAKKELDHALNVRENLSKSMIELFKKHEVESMHQLSELRRKEELKAQEKQSKQAQRKLLETKLQKNHQTLQNVEQEFTRHCAVLHISKIHTKEELEEFEQAYANHQKHYEQQIQLKQELRQIKKNIETLNKQFVDLESKYLEMLKVNHMETVEQFKEALKIKQQMLQLQKENEQIANRMYDLTDGLVLEDFEKEIDFALSDFQKNQSIKEMEEKQTLLRKQLRSKESEIYELDKEISVIEENYTDVYTLNAMLKKAEGDLQELTMEKQAYELANQVIDELSKEIQYEFAPSLNEAISDVMNTITNGKYKDLKIDPETNIKIVDEYVKQLLETKDFSTGTIDQIYFSMRLGLSKVLFEHQFPYILDDTFVNYDEKRLRRVLQILVEEERQVLLFTCHKREHIIAQKEKIPHHYIQLT